MKGIFYSVSSNYLICQEAADLDIKLISVLLFRLLYSFGMIVEDTGNSSFFYVPELTHNVPKLTGYANVPKLTGYANVPKSYQCRKISSVNLSGAPDRIVDYGVVSVFVFFSVVEVLESV
jgi:hypothetical protein